MSHIVENRVRTVFARELELLPSEVRPDMALRPDTTNTKGWRWIKDRLEFSFGIAIAAGYRERWRSIADVIIEIEAAQSAGRARAA